MEVSSKSLLLLGAQNNLYPRLDIKKKGTDSENIF